MYIYILSIFIQFHPWLSIISGGVAETQETEELRMKKNEEEKKEKEKKTKEGEGQVEEAMMMGEIDKKWTSWNMNLVHNLIK